MVVFSSCVRVMINSTVALGQVWSPAILSVSCRLKVTLAVNLGLSLDVNLQIKPCGYGKIRGCD